MMLQTKKGFWFSALLFALTTSLILYSGIAGAAYMGDGATQNGTTGGWNIPNDGVCVVGVHADGTMDIADGVTDRHTCQYLTNGTMNGGTAFNLSGMTSSATCGTANAVGNDGAKHTWATSICVDALGNGISLKDLDRTAAMCAAKGGTWNTTGKCTAYGMVFKGQDANGTPLAFGSSAKGTDASQNAGFCYAAVDVTSARGTQTDCLASQAGLYSWNTTLNVCIYSFGIGGGTSGAISSNAWTSIKNAAGGTTVAAHGALPADLSTYTTYGDCLAAGFSWANWVPKSGTATVAGATIATFDLTRQAPNADDGCLHCHSTNAQYNGPVERFKDSYLKTGHKNMLRKVTAGKNWSGPNASGVLEIYTEAATGPVNFTDATAQISGVDKPLLYIFGDWMAPAPSGLDVVVNMSGAAKYNGGNDYSCAACHTAGWGNTSTTAGLCTASSKTNKTACETAGGVWTPVTGVQAIGTPGYVATQPGDSFPGITFGAAGQWDLEGIQCGRCHNATVPSVTATQIAASAFPATAPTSGGMGALANGQDRTNLCFGCHQSMAKTSNGVGADADLSHPESLPVKNSITTGSCSVSGKTSESACQSAGGVWTPTAYKPMFSGHVLGNSFLNSPHARATATVAPNSLGKYDLSSVTYNSTFRGYACYQSTTSASPAKTRDAAGNEIKTKAECESLYGAGTWRADTGTPGSATSIQGTCTTCHDVHQSLFVAGQEGLRKECESCHSDADFGAAVPGTAQVSASMNHPTGAGTPFDTTEHKNSCEVCHMPKPTDGDFPMHLWRINTDANYSTFPTGTEYGAGTTPARKNANAAADGKGYASAIWVDIDLACGQCHGGGTDSTTSPATKAVYMNKITLANLAKNMHNVMPVANFTANADKTTSYKVSFDAGASICPAGATCNYTWNFGDGSPDGSNVTTDHQYTDGTAVTVTLTVATSAGTSASKSQTVTPAVVAAPPVASASITSVSGMTVTVTDISTDPNNAPLTITVTWGDGTSTTVAKTTASTELTHTYAANGSYTVTEMVSNTSGLSAQGLSARVTVPVKYSVSGSVTRADGTTPLSGVAIFLKQGTTTKYIGSTNTSGVYTVNNVAAGAYTAVPVKAGYTFTPASQSVTVGPNATDVNFQSIQ